MRIRTLVLVSLLVLAPLPGASQPAAPDLDRLAAPWDEVFRRMEAPEIGPDNSFAAYCVDRLLREGRLKQDDPALVLAMGDGRNALYLAERGLRVTGVDISSVGLDKARASAAEKGLEIEAIQADLFRHDLGTEKWQLVTSVYFNPSIQIFERLKAAVKPAGYILVEGYGAGYTGPGPAPETRYRPNQLLAELASWRILEYQDGVFPSDWAGGRPVPVIRILAQKPW
jgi:hypothetical protein